jgi:hypothetical protein
MIKSLDGLQRMKMRAAPACAFTNHLLEKRGTWILLLLALVYYGAYYSVGLSLTGEAGSNILIATRMIEGWRPIKDMFVGYNVLWFYPLVWIFKITGPSLIAAKIFFIGLSTITGLLGFLLVRRATGSAILAFVAAGLMILMPGAIYRNYMGFIGTLAAFALVRGYVLREKNNRLQCLWMGLAGLAVGICFLIRIEPSLLISVVWIGLALLYPFGVRGEFLARVRVSAMGTVLGLVALVAVHAPFVIHAASQGYSTEFLSQYTQFIGLFRWELGQEIKKMGEPAEDPKIKNAVQKSGVSADPNTTVQPAPEGPNASADSQSESVRRDGRSGRPPIEGVLRWKGASFLDMAIYFPVLAAGVIALAGALLFAIGLGTSHPAWRLNGLLLLTTTGCALALFPQYFFFRPDSVHLAEFMVPFYPALACAAFVGIATASQTASVFLRSIGFLLIAFSVAQVIIAFNALYGREGSGSIRSARGRTAEFHAPGGIHSRVRPSELKDWEELRNVLLAHSRPGEYLVTYPYVPILNVMAGRPSYQFKLYVDNATESSHFPAMAIAELEKNKPSIVVINNRDINKTEASRFKNWAAPFYQKVSTNYVLAGTYFGKIEVFVRPDRIADPVK